MGGSYYDRDVETTVIVPSSTSVNTSAPITPVQVINSTTADSLFQGNTQLHESLNPRGKKLRIESSQNPIVVAVDVTGSMGIFAKCIWDKLPMFYGQLRSKNYLPNPAISFAGVGDAYTDKAPLQISEFKQGNALDDSISKLYLEGGGGGQHYESYELCGYYYGHEFFAENTDKKKSFLFFVGDEGFYSKLKAEHIELVIGHSSREDVSSSVIFSNLRKKFHVFFIHKPYWDKTIDAKQLAKWKAVVGPEKVLELTDPKSVVDIMLGAIAIVGNARTLQEYITDLENRGQTPERIEQVKSSLELLSRKSGNYIFPGPGEEDESGTTPKSFFCPITQEIMSDPMLCSDGFAYEKEAIEFWLSSNNSSPVTGAALTSTTLIPQNELKMTITSWQLANSQ